MISMKLSFCNTQEIVITMKDFKAFRDEDTRIGLIKSAPESIYLGRPVLSVFPPKHRVTHLLSNLSEILSEVFEGHLCSTYGLTL